MARPLYNEFGERLDRFRVVLHAYCGMRQTLAECETYADARAEVARILRAARNDAQPVSTIGRGVMWELEEPDDCAMVPDNAGTLLIRYPAHEDEE